MNFNFSKSSIVSIQCITPSIDLDLISLSKEIGIDLKEANKIINTTGIEKVKIANYNQTSVDLCYDATSKMLSEMSNDEIEKIDALIFVSQTRDYIMPQSSNILQKN